MVMAAVVVAIVVVATVVVSIVIVAIIIVRMAVSVSGGSFAKPTVGIITAVICGVKFSPPVLYMGRRMENGRWVECS
jgi:hypothetical protein